MKKKLFTLPLILFLFFLANKTLAQDAPSSIAVKNAASLNLRNAVVNIDNQSYDYRVLRHYSQKDLLNIPESKRKKILYIYTESYKVLDFEKCPALKVVDIDVDKLEIYRKENTSTIVSYGNECKVQIELISRKDLNDKLSTLN